MVGVCRLVLSIWPFTVFVELSDLAVDPNELLLLPPSGRVDDDELTTTAEDANFPSDFENCDVFDDPLLGTDNASYAKCDILDGATEIDETGAEPNAETVPVWRSLMLVPTIGEE